MQAADKKRPKEEKDILHRLRPFARLQTAEDFEAFQADILCKCQTILQCLWNDAYSSLAADEHYLRKRISELQHYRRMGLRTAADIERYEADLVKRVRDRGPRYLRHAATRSSHHHRRRKPRRMRRRTTRTEYNPGSTTQDAHPLDRIRDASLMGMSVKLPPRSAQLGMGVDLVHRFGRCVCQPATSATRHSDLASH